MVHATMGTMRRTTSTMMKSTQRWVWLRIVSKRAHFDNQLGRTRAHLMYSTGVPQCLLVEKR